MGGELGPILRYDGRGRPVYRYGRAPGTVATARQLRAAGLSPAGLKPVAWLYYARIGHRICPLYDRAAARPRRPLSERQRQVLAEGRKLAHTVPCKRCGKVRVSVWEEHFCDPCWEIVRTERYAAWERRMQQEAEDHERMLERDRRAAAVWAAEVLADPTVIVLDSETTGLCGAYLVELAVVDVGGRVLLDTLVNPGMPIPPEAAAIHGITEDMVADAPTFAEILPRLGELLTGRRLVIYNSSFDVGVLCNELDRHHAATFPSEGYLDGDSPWRRHLECQRRTAVWWQRVPKIECAMQRYAEWFGEWHDYWGNYTWQPLGGGHRARGDCLAVLDRLAAMARADQPLAAVPAPTGS